MKELSLGEKARLYDEAIKRAREFVCKYNVEVAEYIFPELSESEDEKIRKELIIYLYNELNNITQLTPRTNEFERWIDWLEKKGEKESIILKFREGDVIEYKSKQWTIIGVDLGNHCYDLSNDECVDFDTAHYAFKLIEQTSPDKVKPKFHEGQWIVWQDKCYKVNYNGCGYELVDQDGLSTSLEYGTVEKSAHVFTIQDAKDGDVLADSKSNINIILMFRGIGNTKWDDVIDYHCYYNCHKKSFIIQKDVEYWGNRENNQLKPATKEQRDLLFQKMKEAGYEWDVDKKKLKKIELCSSQWNISDFRTWQYIVSDVLTKHDGIGQYLDDGLCKKIAKYMQEEWSKKLNIV